MPRFVMSQTPDQALEKIEKVRQVRQGKFYLRDETITLSHGSGGKAMHNLIEGLIAPTFANPILDRMDDAAPLTLPGVDARLAFTTDSYVVSPIFFPGGDIGKLAVHGTVNDLAMAGAQPLWLSVGLILEEGLAIADLKRVLQSMQTAAAAAGVQIVTGDTKVVSRGQADKIFINTAGIGIARSSLDLSVFNAQPGDKVLLSGPVGNHGIAIMLAREALEIETDVESDTAPLHTLVADLLAAAVDGLHCLKDPTRGGLATSINEIALSSAVAIALDERLIPIDAGVRGACEILGLDPLTIANEGKLLAVVAADVAAAALSAMQTHPLGRQAAIIGEVQAEPTGMVFLRTGLGGARVLDMLVGDPLPRIC
jgi:hydrogenase expression/formation protein HypE